MSARTFKLESPHMKGDDIRSWQQELVERFDKWNIGYPLAPDGDYGQATRSATASFMRAWGVEDTGEALADGLTPWWRTKLRGDQRSEQEEINFKSAERVAYRSALRKRYDDLGVCYPVPNLISDDWGYHPPIHDGIDLICPANQPILAICNGIVVRADAAGWWGKGAPSDPNLKAKGDGIIIVESRVETGPFKSGLHFGYGHAEGAVVREGQRVTAGQHLGHAGFANAWHVHFMVNFELPREGLYRGVGDRDPAPYLSYSRINS